MMRQHFSDLIQGIARELLEPDLLRIGRISGSSRTELRAITGDFSFLDAMKKLAARPWRELSHAADEACQARCGGDRGVIHQFDDVALRLPSFSFC